MGAEKEIGLGLSPQYVVDDNGKPTAVILDTTEYRALLEQVEYSADAAALQAAIESETEFRPWREVRAEIERKRTA
ncbi:MAG: hypothetical protein M3R04_07855 [bacterium]|nr:hypothetical protein [bacterium]